VLLHPWFNPECVDSAGDVAPNGMRETGYDGTHHHRSRSRGDFFNVAGARTECRHSSAAPSGDAAVSPAAGNPVNDGSASANRHDLGAGIASGAVNNGTTGDTIGTGHGTSSAPATGPASASPAAGDRKQ
jgi:hypothetical protein